MRSRYLVDALEKQGDTLLFFDSCYTVKTTPNAGVKDAVRRAGRQSCDRGWPTSSGYPVPVSPSPVEFSFPLLIQLPLPIQHAAFLRFVLRCCSSAVMMNRYFPYFPFSSMPSNEPLPQFDFAQLERWYRLCLPLQSEKKPLQSDFYHLPVKTLTLSG